VQKFSIDTTGLSISAPERFICIVRLRGCSRRR
jgi:hypothetical protein